MPNRLKPLNVVRLHWRRQPASRDGQLLENEVPELLNMEVDPRGGMNMRKAWKYINATPVDTVTWDPRNADVHITSPTAPTTSRRQQGDPTHYRRSTAGVKTATSSPRGCSAAPAHVPTSPRGTTTVLRPRGRTRRPRDGTNGTTVAACAAGPTGKTTTPTRGHRDDAPSASSSLNPRRVHVRRRHRRRRGRYPNRIRWSHPNNPYAGPDDYIDITEGGHRITAMIRYSDRLLVFKPDSVWALFGSDAETWELTNISRTVGCVHQQVICRNESAVFFMSWPHGVFAYTERGNVDEISVPIRAAFPKHGSTRPSDRRHLVRLGRPSPVVLVAVRGHPPAARSPGPSSSRTRCWRAGLDDVPRRNCTPGPYIERVDIDSPQLPVAFIGSTALVVLDEITDAATDECASRSRHRVRDTAAHPLARRRSTDLAQESWRRPDLLIRALTFDTTLNCRVFHNYDSANAERSFEVEYTPDNLPAKWGHFDYGDGTKYGGPPRPLRSNVAGRWVGPG